MRMPAGAMGAVVMAACGAFAAPPASGATSSGLVSLTGAPLPMAVRQGAVAEVSVHAVPFPLGSSALEGGVASALDALLATAATDCFLFAQIVGHVTPGSQADGDTLVAHRLARARADTVRAALARAGVPGDEVATTWDRAFGTREPRATLWLFERPLGEDCAGTALPGAPPRATVAATTGSAESELERRVSAFDPAEPAPGIHIPADGPAAARLAVIPATASPPAAPGPISTAVPARSAVELEPAPGIHLPRPQLGTGEAAAVSPNSSGPFVAAPTMQLAQWTATEALPEDPALGVPGTATPEPQAGPASGPIGSADLAPEVSSDATAIATSVLFDRDSSFLTPEAKAELAELLGTMQAAAGSWRAELVVAVGRPGGRATGRSGGPLQ